MCNGVLLSSGFVLFAMGHYHSKKRVVSVIMRTYHISIILIGVIILTLLLIVLTSSSGAVKVDETSSYTGGDITWRFKDNQSYTSITTGNNYIILNNTNISIWKPGSPVTINITKHYGNLSQNIDSIIIEFNITTILNSITMNISSLPWYSCYDITQNRSYTHQNIFPNNTDVLQYTINTLGSKREIRVILNHHMMMPPGKTPPVYIFTGETRNTSSVDTDRIYSRPLTPLNSTINGSIRIISDYIVFYGNNSNVSYVNISYDNRETMKNDTSNTSYIPSRLEVQGENITIRTKGYLKIVRYTIWRQYKEIGWISFNATGQRLFGHLMTSPLSTNEVTIYDGQLYIGFDNNSIPSTDTFTLQKIEWNDTLNKDKLVPSNYSYRVSPTGVEVYLGVVNHDFNETLSYSYYVKHHETHQYTEAVESVTGYQKDVLDTKTMYSIYVSWRNMDSSIFKGNLYVKLDFDGANRIDGKSLIIVDLDHEQRVSSHGWQHDIGFIRVNSDIMGEVYPGQGRHFRVYFDFKSYPGEEVSSVDVDVRWVVLGVGLFCAGFLLYRRLYR